MSFTPTTEQQQAIDDALTGENTVIEAGAGTGKTSTLKLISAALAPKKGLYIAYNKAIQLDAAKSFPANTNCRTSHSLAFGQTGKRYANRCFKGPRVTGRQAASILDIDRSFPLGNDRELSDVAQARLVMDTVRNFCNSADEGITRTHVPMVPGAEEVSYDLASHVVKLAEKAWADLLRDDRQGGGRLKFTQDMYLKIWALSKPKLNYDFIFVDEAQDSNTCLMGVVLAQDAQLIAVGDRSQAIYGWRGAVDAMSKFPAERRTVLSQSFRFGPAVATVANRFLDMLDAPLRLTGTDKIDSVVQPLPQPKAILCRTNAGVIQAALATPAGQSFAIVGGGDTIEKFADAAEALMSGRTAGWHADLGAFKSWSDVEEYADEGDGADLKVLVNLVRDYGTAELRRIAKASLPPSREHEADRIISTAHKAKGREWESVLIASDFTPSDERQEQGISRDEQMLAYVAVTRAMKRLDPSGLAWALGAT